MTTQQESIRLVRDKVQYILGLSACEDNRDFPTIYNACYDILSVLDSVQPTPMPEAIAKAREALLSAHQEIEATGIAEGVHFGDDPLVSEKIVNALAALDYVITTNAQTVCQQPIVAMQQGGSITGGSMFAVKEPDPVSFSLSVEEASLLRDSIGEGDEASEITLSVGPSKDDEGNEYYGLRLHWTDYPEEGCVPICNTAPPSEVK